MCLNFKRIRNDKLDVLREISIKTFIETFASQNKEENIKQYLETKMSLANLKEELNNHQKEMKAIEKSINEINSSNASLPQIILR